MLNNSHIDMSSGRQKIAKITVIDKCSYIFHFFLLFKVDFCCLNVIIYISMVYYECLLIYILNSLSKILYTYKIKNLDWRANS